MTTSKSRSATKNIGTASPSIGSKIVRFKVRNIDRRFAVHEDLICRTSTLFKTQLQHNRKTLALTPAPGSEEECCVCQDDLNPTTKDITYCVTCGQSIHDTCIEQWKQSCRANILDRTAPTCPMCRAPWKNEPLLKHLTIDTPLDPEAVQTYLDYLYSGTLSINPSLSRKTDAFNVFLLKCWTVSITLSDKPFKHAIIRTFFTEATSRFWAESVKWAFGEGHADQEIREFVVEVFMAFVDSGWFGRESGQWDSEFVKACADRALEVWVGRKGYREVRREWLARMDGGDGSDDLEEVKIVPRDKILETKGKDAGKKRKAIGAGLWSRKRVQSGAADESGVPGLEASGHTWDEFDDWDLSRFVGARP
ncbi:hypothetical protein BKA63DRAFT_597993 [Paraphoma chrysanthemicola]|nr:hypothetical protein BKA63DRAFT_597993 [Paraphoma chrysanthemicola]